jgi:chorismate synthase
MMRFLTAGESHGPALVAVIEGLPAGLEVDFSLVDRDLARRQGGYGRGGRMGIESDRVQALSGLRFGRTLGSPLAFLIENKDFANWRDRMAPCGDKPAELAAVTRPRPGHADLPGALKYGHTDLRDVLERASARETAARTAVGGVAKQLLSAFGISVIGHVLAVGPVTARPWQGDPAGLAAAAEASPVRCADPAVSEAIVRRIDLAREQGDSLGGVLEVVATGVPVGLGSHVHWDRRLDGRLAAALMSIPAIKGVEVGGGFGLAALPGSRAHDEIAYSPQRGYHRLSNRAGGLEGGITNGGDLVLRAAMKPIPTLCQPLRSVDMSDHRPSPASVERSDVCAVPAAAVVAEAAVAWEVACALREKFGGDSLGEMLSNFDCYLRGLQER